MKRHVKLFEEYFDAKKFAEVYDKDSPYYDNEKEFSYVTPEDKKGFEDKETNKAIWAQTEDEFTRQSNNNFGGNTAVYKGKPFWIGTMNVLDKQIENIYTYKKASMGLFNHSLFMNYADREAVKNSERMMFWITPEHKIKGFWRDVIPPRDIQQIQNQIEFLTDASQIEVDSKDINYSETGEAYEEYGDHPERYIKK